MKTTYYFCSLLICLSLGGQAVYAQTASPTWAKTAFASGRWQVGLSDGYGRGNLLRNYNSLQARVGYYIVDKLLVGIGADWSKEWSGSLALHDLTVGPLVRYQFMRARFSPFLEASYQFGRRGINPDWSASYPSISIQTVLISPGLSIGLTPSLRLDVSYGYQNVVNLYPYTNGQFQLGVNYLFGGK